MLWWCAANGWTPIVRLLLLVSSICGFPQLADVHYDDDRALRSAAVNGHAKTARVLLQAGANVHADRDFALLWAVNEGNTEIVQVLLQGGADVHVHNNRALLWAARKGRTEIVQALLQARSTYGFTQCADVHAKDDQALRGAVEKGHTKTVKVLLQARSTCGFTHCADIHAKNDWALCSAAQNGHVETVQVLLQAGANIHVGDDYVLRWAARNSHTKIVQVLLQACSTYSFTYRDDHLTFVYLNLLSPKFILSLRDEVIAGMEAAHPEVKEKYKNTRSRLKEIKREQFFTLKISLADLYYRPGATGYYQAINF